MTHHQVHREDLPSGPELPTPSSPAPTLTIGQDTDSDFDKYKDFDMDPVEMYARYRTD